jgi:hypothetical protein
MSVKPFSSLCIRSRSIRSICLLLEVTVGWVCLPAAPVKKDQDEK